jgi:integrase
VITLPPARTKTKRLHEIFLSPPALAVLEAQARDPERDLVFGRGGHGWRGWSKSKAELDARVSVRDWTLHDFRRVLSTRLHETLGIQPHVIEALLGHVQPGIGAVYNKADYADAKYAALVKWGEYVDGLVSGKRSAAVVKLRRRG